MFGHIRILGLEAVRVCTSKGGDEEEMARVMRQLSCVDEPLSTKDLHLLRQRHRSEKSMNTRQASAHDKSNCIALAMSLGQ